MQVETAASSDCLIEWKIALFHKKFLVDQNQAIRKWGSLTLKVNFLCHKWSKFFSIVSWSIPLNAVKKSMDKPKQEKVWMVIDSPHCILIYQLFFMKKCYLPLNFKAPIWCGSWWKILKWYLLITTISFFRIYDLY